jgi:hypothetical protein
MLKISTLVVVCVAAVSAAALADDTKMGDLSSSRGLSALAAGGNSDSRPQLSVNPRSGLDGELNPTKGATIGTGLKASAAAGSDPSLKFGSKLPSGPDDRLSSFSAGSGDASAFSNASSSSSLSALSQPVPTTMMGADTSADSGTQLKALKSESSTPTQMLKR